MRAVVKIRGIIAMADVSQKELAILSGVSASRVSYYLDLHHELENYDGGLKLLQTARKLMKLVEIEKLPLDPDIKKDMRLVELLSLMSGESITSLLGVSINEHATSSDLNEQE